MFRLRSVSEVRRDRALFELMTASDSPPQLRRDAIMRAENPAEMENGQLAKEKSQAARETGRFN
jgi:hypothetical protein